MIWDKYYPPTWQELEQLGLVRDGKVLAAELKRILDTMELNHPLRNLDLNQSYRMWLTKDEYCMLFLKETDKTEKSLKSAITEYLKDCGDKRFKREEDFKVNLFSFLKEQGFDVKKEVDLYPDNNKGHEVDLRADIIVHVKEGFVPIELKYDNTRKLCIKDIEETEWYVQSYEEMQIGFCVFLYSKNCETRFGENDISEMAYGNDPYPLTMPYFFKWQESNNMDNTKQGEMSYYSTIIEVVEDGINVKKNHSLKSFLRLWYEKKYD